MADYVSPAANFSNVLTGFDISEITSTYGATAKLYKPGETSPLTTVSSATSGSSVNFEYSETSPQDVTYTLEVTDDLGRTSRYDLPRKWISYAMETNETPGFQKLALAGNEYTSTTIVPNLTSSSKARVYKTGNHGYLGINFKIQGRNSTNDAWVDIDNTGENENADESKEFLAFGDYLYHRVWVKPTAKATTTVTSSNVVTLTLSNLTEENLTTSTSFVGLDPYDINESTNTYVFEETTKIGTVPFTVTLDTETYTNAFTATTLEFSSTPNTDMTAAGPNMKHQITVSSLSRFHEVSADGKFIAWSNQSGVIQVMKGDPESGYTNYTTFTHSQSTKNDLVGSISYDGKYIINGCIGVNQHHEIWKHDESTGTYSKLSQTAPEIGSENRLHKPSFVPRSGNYDFAVTGTDNNNTFRVQLYKHNAGTDTWTAQTEITDVTSRPTSDGGRARYAKQFTQDGRYLMVGSTGTYGGYEMYTVDWDANTVVFSGANYVENGSIGHSGGVTLDGKYVLIFHNDSNSRKIFKNNDAGDWSSATDVTSDFTFNNTDDDQGHDISFCGESSEFFLSGMRSGNLRMYSWYPKKEVTLAFSNPTLTLTGKNVTISSAKLYRDDVLFHTYGTESNVVLRSDQTGTYQAIVNDVYYSNRVTPDFTTTRSVSAPQLEFDGYNKLTLANYITTTSDFPSIITFDVSAWSGAPTTIWYVLDTTKSTDTSKFYETNAPTTGDAGNDGTATGIEFRCETDGTTKVYANTDDNTSQPNTLNVNSTSYPSNYVDGVTVTSGDILYGLETWGTRFGFTVTSSMLFTRTVITPTSTTLGVPDGTTRDLTTQSNVYIYKSGTYTANVQTSDTFAYLSNVVSSISNPPEFSSTPSVDVTWQDNNSSTNRYQTSEILGTGDGTYKVVFEHGAPLDDANQLHWGFVIMCNDKNDLGNSRGSNDSKYYYIDFILMESYFGQRYYGGSGTSWTAPLGGYAVIENGYQWIDADKSQVQKTSTSKNPTESDHVNGRIYMKVVIDSTRKSENKEVELQFYEDSAFTSKFLTLWMGNAGTHSAMNSDYQPTQTGVNRIKIWDEHWRNQPLTMKIYQGNTFPTLTFDNYNRLAIENITQTSSTLTDPNGSTFNTNTASNVYVTDAGEYKLEARDANTFVMSNVYVGALDTIPEFTAAFHHGAFSASDYSSAYSSVTAAATAGFVYSDTPAGTYTWGTLAARVKERENPDFTANSTLHTDYSSTYGWTTNSGWAVSADSQHDNSEANYGAWKAFDKLNNTFWHSNHSSGVTSSTPATLTIQYPSSQVIKSYNITSRDDDNNTRFPSVWKLQGYDGSSWVDVGSEQTVTTWTPGATKRFDVSDNTTAYTKYQLRITTTIRSASDSTSDFAAIAAWKLYTLNSENNTVHDDHTEYTWTPVSTITANVLRVAGGGAGGNTRSGGGGAGGLLYSENVSLSGAKKIVVGNGGKGKIGNQQMGDKGHDTLFEGLTTVVGGGSAAGERPGTEGGSSGGNSGRSTSTATAPYPSGQGNAGGTAGADNFNGAGGGGAGGVGANQSSGIGGIGLDYSSVFGTTYGESGWFAGGGGGGGGTRAGGQGGGGDGTNTGTPGPGQKHTGGGSGGKGNSENTNKMSDGGSGIVIIKKLGATNPPTLNFDGYNKLSIDNVSLSPDPFPNTISITYNNLYGSGGGNYSYQLQSSSSTSTSKFYELYSGSTAETNTYGIEFRHESDGSTKLYVNSDNNNAQPAAVKTNDTTTSAEDVVLTSNTTEVILENTAGSSYYATFSVTADMFFKNTPPDTSVTIKKDGAAFATTTSNTVYIREEGTYTAEVKGLDAYAIELSKEVSTINNAPDWRETQFQLLYSENPNQNDYFGIGVDIDGDYACIGSPYDDTNGGDKGAVYVFHKSNGVWTYQDILQPDSTSENFAVSFTSLSIHGDTIAVGAQANDTGGSDFGAVYVFRRNGTSWSKEAKLQSSDAQAGDNFGSGVGIYGDYIVAGAYAEDTGGNRAGSAYIFKRTDTIWQQKVKIQSGDQSIDDKFGVNCKIYGDYVIVGALEEDIGGTEFGAAYIFKKNADETWSKTATLLASDGAYLDRIGVACYIYDEYAIVGGPTKDNGGTDRGSAYIFKKNVDESWTEQAILTSDDPTDNYRFGTSTYIKGNYAIVGESGSDANTGSFMYVFERSGSTWTQVKKFQVTNGQNANFGSSVAISGDTILSGAPYDDVKNVNAGACYVFSKTPPGPYATYDNYNKITLNQLNYADTTNVTYYSNTYELGTAKTMYVKDAGEYVFKISGTDKYVESNVYVSSVDLAGASTKPIDFDGYNKLTLIDAGSNVSANVTYFSNTYELGSANVLYINGAGTYGLEMSGSNVFALSSNVVSGTVNSQRNATYKDFTYTETRIKSTWDNYDTTHSPPLDFTFKTGSDFNNSTLIGLGYTEGFNVSRWWIVSSDTHDFATHGTGSSVSHYNWGSDGTVAVNQGTEYAWFTRTIPSTVVDVSGTYKVNLGAQLTFDNYNKLTLENFTTTDTLWPPSDGTWSISTDTSTLSEWTISGASYGNGSYKAASSVATNGIFRAYQAFEGTEPGNTSSWQIMATAGILSIELPESVLINKYALLNRNYNLSEDQDASPKDFTFEGSSDGSTWVVLDTVTGNGYYTAEGTASQQTFTMSNTTAYKHYRLNVTTINGGSAMVVGELKLLVNNPRTAKLTDPNDVEYTLGQTQNDIYIEETGDYFLEVTNSDQSAVVKKTIGVGSINNNVPESTITYPVYKATSDTQPSSYYTAAASQNKRYNDGVVTMDFFNYYNGALSTQWLLFDGDTTVEHYNNQGLFTFQWNNNVVKKVMKMRIFGSAPSNGGTSFKTEIKATSSDSWTTLNTYDRTTDYTNNAWNEFPINQEVYACRLNFDGFSHGAAYWHMVREFEVVAIDDSVPPPPTLTFDNYNKLSINNLTPTSSRLTYGSNTYEIGTASNVYIEHGGTYKMATGDANTFALVSNVVGEIVTPTPSFGGSANDTITLSNGAWSGTIFQRIPSKDNTNGYINVFFDPNNAGGSNDYSGFEFRAVNNATELHMDTDDNYWDPGFFSIDGGTTKIQVGEINIGDTVILYRDTQPGTGALSHNEDPTVGTAVGEFTVTTDHLFSYGPSFTYDTSNKLSITGITPTSTTLTDPNGSRLDIGTVTDVYIRDSGKYAIASKDANTFVLTSNTVTGTPTGTTYAYSTNTITNIGLNKEIDSASAHHGQYTHGAASNTGRINDLNFTKTILTNGYPTDFSVIGTYVARTSQTLENGQWTSSSATSGAGATTNPYFRINLEKDYYVDNCVLHRTMATAARYENVRFQLLDSSETQIKEVNVGDFGATNTFMTADCKVSGVRYVKVVTYSSSGYTHYDELRINGYDSTLLDGSATTPSQTYDNTKTITVSNVPAGTSTVGKIYKGSTAYTIHATEPTSNVIIKNTGTYVSVFTTATQAFLTNAVNVNATPESDDTTIEDEALDVTTTTSVAATVAFHHGTFDDSGDPHGDGSITAAATAGHIYSDTAPGTYTWGTLTSGEFTDFTNTSGGSGNDVYRNGSPPTAGFTTYKWTPPSAITNGRTLVVAGGGGGGMDIGGGGGAGGLLASTTTNIAHTEQTIQVGGGGAKGYDPNNGNYAQGGNGADSSISGPGITSIGGGGGATEHSANNARPAGNGGSGGGCSGGQQNSSSGSFGGTGTPGQGHDGQYQGNTWYPGGGGGAGEAGHGGGTAQGHGGDGLEDDILGTSYWWAGGGGGAGHSGNAGNGGKGGGGGGAQRAGSYPTPLGDTNGITPGENGETSGSWNSTNGGDGGKHTGGGGGGGQYNHTVRGGLGGSGIVAIKFTAQKTVTVPGIPGSTAVPSETVVDTPSATLDATDTTVTEPTLNLDFTTTLPKTLKRYNGLSNSSIGARFNRRETKKKRIEKSISIPSSFSAELTANNASSPTTLTVTVANSKFVINSDETPTLAFIRGETYTFDQSDASNSGHPLVLATSADGTQYTTGWVNNVFTVPYDVPDTIYYKCSNHNNMGGEIHTTFGNAFSLGDFTVAANTHVSGEYTLAVNYDGTTSNLYVNGSLITQTTRTINTGTKDFILGKEFDGYVKNFKFWNRVLVPKGIPYLSQLGDMSSGSWYDEGTTQLAPNKNSNGVAQTSGEDWTDNNGVTYTIWGFDLYNSSTGLQQPHADSASWITFKPGTTTSNGTWYWGTPSNTAASRSGNTISIYEGSSLRAQFTDTNMFVDGTIPITPNPKTMNNDT